MIPPEFWTYIPGVSNIEGENRNHKKAQEAYDDTEQDQNMKGENLSNTQSGKGDNIEPTQDDTLSSEHSILSHVRTKIDEKFSDQAKRRSRHTRLI